MKIISGNKSFFMTNNGCIRRKIDAQHIIDFLLKNGYKKTEWLENADLLFFVSCAADNAAEGVAIKAILDFAKRKKKQAKIYVIGCLSKINPHAISNIEDIACIIGPAEMNHLDFIFPDLDFPFKNIPEPYRISNEVFFQKGLNFFREDKNKSIEFSSLSENLLDKCQEAKYEEFKSKSNIVRIARGCLSGCKYCCIRKATGRLVSRPIDAILDQFRRILSVSSPYFTLTAEDSGAYGLDIGTNFPKLLNGIAALDNKIELAVNAFNPRWIIPVIDELDMVMSDTHILKHIVAPVQSGSDYVLSRMGRGHSIADGMRFFEMFEKYSNELQVHTHLIIGFPGERPSDIDDTIRFMKRFPQIHYYIYPYNDRPGTISSNCRDKLSNEEIEKRYHLVTEVKMELVNLNNRTC